jgi:hypothetical protein
MKDVLEDLGVDGMMMMIKGNGKAVRWECVF